MANLRLSIIKVLDSTTIRAKFTESLDSLINTANVTVESNTSGVPDAKVLSVKVNDNILTVNVRPLTPFASYYVKFASTDQFKFKSKAGNYLFEDGVGNQKLIGGPADPANPIRDHFVGYLKDNVYDLTNGTIVNDIVNSQADLIAKAFHDVGQLKNDNYLSFTVTDEVKVRGSGPYDRLVEEGAYEILRVAKKATGSTSSTSYSFTEFPSSPITLQAVSIVNEKLSAGSGFNGLILTASKRNVTKLKKVRIAYQNGSSAVYDISSYGYQILEPKYDTDFASPYLILEDNQFKISDAILETSFVSPKAGDFIYIDYEYKDLGRFVDEESVTVSQVLDSVREVTPPIQTKFSLAYAPIVSDQDVIFTSGGITFLDPNANPPFSAIHPAFETELPFRLDGLPRNPGEYCVDYNSGQIYVYGAVTNDGTGNFPPVVTYKYRKTYDAGLDYTYNADTLELAANPLRELIGLPAKISFSYEQTLVPGIDYNPQVHKEILDERIENRLLNLGTLAVEKAPVTNVFRVYNETTGEIYRTSRFNNDKVYFSYTNPPRILEQTRERVSFTDVSNETLIIEQEFVNTLGTRILKVQLANNRVMSSSEDCVGSSFNSSANFSRTDIFVTELYFDGQIFTVTQNTDRLLSGQYQLDYENGTLYVGVENSQNSDLGTINYKKSTISPLFSHVISVSELYNSISIVDGIAKRIPYLTFSEGTIQPAEYVRADERFLNEDTTLPYLVESNTIVVSDSIKDVRGIYDVYDLNTNVTPINFADGTTFSSKTIVLSDGVEKKEVLSVQSGNIINATFVSTGIEISSVLSVVRQSDGVDLWSTPGSFLNYQITLSGSGTPVPGDVVLVTYKVIMNGDATPVVDYNRGDYYADYSFLADEILVSYEYGDNNIDFRESDALNEGEQYFVTYKAGALRDALLKNFGSLVNLPILNSFDTSLERETYRDALKAALQSFTKGPTVPAIKSIASNITHVDPEIEESAFQNWSLGTSRLYQSDIETTGTIELLSGKYDNGVFLSKPGQSVTLPISSNLRLEEGTMEMWVIPQWDGLDNDASLTFSVKKDGYVLDESDIYIGSDSHHPVYDDNNEFVVNRMDVSSPIGLPSAIFTQTGVFIYYDDTAKRWKFYAKNSTTTNALYTGTIESSGEVYDVKFIPGLGEINDVLRSTSNKIEFKFNLDGYDTISPDGYVDGYSVIDGYSPGDGYTSGYSFDGISFMADEEHYFFDFGKTVNTNRFSLFKDGKGYLNFRVNDKGSPRTKTKGEYKVSANIADWKAGEKHHVATSWRLNSSDRRDEMHLFIDGLEVPNILKYGGRPIGTSTDRFRAVKPEILSTPIPKVVIAGNDLVTTATSNTVTSNTDFAGLGVLAGDVITINEPGFSYYTILSVTGSSLVLDTPLPSSFTDARYSVNQFSMVVTSELDLSSNIAVSLITAGVEREIPGLRADIPSYSISKNSLNQNVLTILGSANVGDQVAIRTLGLNHRRSRDTQYVWGNTQSILKTQLPPPINLDEVKITAVLLPYTFVGPSNSILSGGQFTATLSPTQPSNSSQGRTLTVRIAGGNVTFSPVTTVTINGTTQAGPLFETLTFTSPTSQNTINKFKTITSVVVTTTPVVTTQNSIGIEIKEAYSITYSEGNNVYPVIRFSYKVQTGKTLSGNFGSGTVTDLNGYFVDSNIGQKLVINSPGGAAGTYTITSKINDTSVVVTPTMPVTFSNGTYDIFNVTLGRSGYQNGYFVLEQAGATNVAFALPKGFYEFDYSSYMEVPFDPVDDILGYIGSDFTANKQAKSIIDEFRILSTRLTDIRVGESIVEGSDYITTDATALRPFKPNSNTLALMHFDDLPLVNSADYWVSSTKEFLQAGASVNSNFGQSLVVTDKPLILDNKGILTTSSEGSIEFWVSPKYDTYNDPQVRYYFDAASSVVEEVVSLTNGTVKVVGKIGQVVSVRLASDATNTGVDYYPGGSVGTDSQTIKLQKPLPFQQVPVKVVYVPSGLTGNRISIYKDSAGFITLNVKSNDKDFQVRQPVFWQRDTWHRVQATYKFNRPDDQDELRLFIDSEERGVIYFGSGLKFGEGVVFGQGFSGVSNTRLIADINFKDPINKIYIGSDFMEGKTAYARFDNLRLSNKARAPVIVGTQPKDVNYSSNLALVYPVVEDVFTTYLLNFDSLIKKEDDFALLKDESFGIFDFTVKIIDSFGIVSGNEQVKQILETLIKTLKPAHSRVTITYI